MFRRNPPAAGASAPADGTSEEIPAVADTPARRSVTAAKGRPTPKRNEAAKRRQPYIAPKDRKDAARQARARGGADRARRTEAMRAGEEWALSARDRGPVRGLTRDYVDSSRRLSEFYMYGLLVLMVLLFVHNTAVQTVIPLVVLVAIVIMIIEGILVGRRARQLAAERFPGQSVAGIRWYAAMRALQIRQLRVPKPRVKAGGQY